MSHYDVPERDAELSRDGDGCFVSSSPCCYCQCPLLEWMKSVQHLASEVKQVKKVANGRGVGWGIVADRRVVRRVWQVIAAAAGDRRQAPVVFDELQNRNMVRIVVGNVARVGVRRNHNQRNARAVAEEIERLHISRVVIAAAFIHRHENRSASSRVRDLTCTRSTIFLANPSNKSHFDEAGWPSTQPLGLTNDTAGKCPFRMSW